MRRILPSPVNTFVVLSLLGSSVRNSCTKHGRFFRRTPSTIYELEPLGQKPETDQTQPLIDWLPIWGKDARDKGFDLPLPMGVGVTYSYIPGHHRGDVALLSWSSLDLCRVTLQSER